MNTRRFLYSGLILLFAAGFTLFNLPGDTQKQLIPFLPDSITNSKISLGLDLQGGTQLDYKIDLRKVPEADRNTIVNGIINVISKRINGLGVAEPNIYSSVVGDENHIIVELAGIKDMEEAKATVGKTIQLEFKELREEPDPNHAEEIRKQAEAALEKVKIENNFEVFGLEESQANPQTVRYSSETEFRYIDQLSGAFQEAIPQLEPGQIADQLLEPEGEMTVSPAGEIVQQNGFYLVKLLEKQEAEREYNEPRKVYISEILIAHNEVSTVPEGVERSKDEARALAEEVRQKVIDAENAPAPEVEAVEGASTEEIDNQPTFASLAQEYSDNATTKENGGEIAAPVIETAVASETFTKEVADTAIAFNEVGQISEVLESPLGFHIIKAREIKTAINETRSETQYKIATIFYNSADDPWAATGLDGRYFQRANVEFDDLVQPIVSISFNAEGAEMFERLTEKNINKPLAIFVGGELVSAPNVNQKISGGNAVISGNFSIREAEELARDLNTGAIPAPIILVGQYSIGASLGQDALTSSLEAGLIGLGLIFIFMVIYYRGAGILASLALFVYTAILVFLIKVAMPLYISLPLAIAVFIYLILAILNGKDSGPEKLVSLVLNCFVLFFFSFLLSTPVVLTLAGVAGVILSIGMAVDANILIFERVKEELRDGRPLESAIKVGFDRAWSSIKDSNFSSLITCAILFYFGSSIIQGFAFNLAAGILVSMFSAITITRILLKSFVGTKFGESATFFGTPKKQNAKIWPIIKTRKISYVVSAILIIASLVGLGIFGLKPGLDFTGGTLMEIKFQETITNQQVTDALTEIQANADQVEPTMEDYTAEVAEEVSEQNPEQASEEVPTTEIVVTTDQEGNPVFETKSSSDAELSAVEAQTLDLGTPVVITSNESIIIKTRDITSDQHDLIINEFQSRFGELEETRFQSVGPTVGESMRYKAIIAVIIAAIAIIFYIAFAFRRVPKSVGKWKFGLTAIVALFHDIIIMLGIYIFLGGLMGVEIDALFITALLTTMGFSVHDTIVVLDRLRERLKAPAKGQEFEDITNIAVNETVSRSINTSITTALALLALAIIGAESIRFFNIALLLGILIGTYSSIFIASPFLVDWYNWRNK